MSTRSSSTRSDRLEDPYALTAIRLCPLPEGLASARPGLFRLVHTAHESLLDRLLEVFANRVKPRPSGLGRRTALSRLYSPVGYAGGSTPLITRPRQAALLHDCCCTTRRHPNCATHYCVNSFRTRTAADSLRTRIATCPPWGGRCNIPRERTCRSSPTRTRCIR